MERKQENEGEKVDKEKERQENKKKELRQAFLSLLMA